MRCERTSVVSDCSRIVFPHPLPTDLETNDRPAIIAIQLA